MSVGGLAELAVYIHLFAIDTATREIDGERVSIAAFFGFNLAPEGEAFRITPDSEINIYEFRNAGGNPEMLAILKIANDIDRTPGLPEGARIAIITDSDLGAHDAINHRTRPIYGDHRLPPRFTIVYASGETGNELVKEAIQFCDRMAAEYLAQLLDGKIPDSPLKELAEDSNVRYRFSRHKGPLDAKNRLIRPPRIGPSTRVTLYGIK